jgi:hypothetical protein
LTTHCDFFFSDEAKRRALEIALIQAAEARLAAEAARLELQERVAREVRLMEAADAEAEHYRMMLMMQDRELRRRRSAELVLREKLDIIYLFIYFYGLFSTIL